MEIRLTIINSVNDLPLYIDEDFSVHLVSYVREEQQREFDANGKSEYHSNLEDFLSEILHEFPEVGELS